jgi:hypothetical protein
LPNQHAPNAHAETHSPISKARGAEHEHGRERDPEHPDAEAHPEVGADVEGRVLVGVGVGTGSDGAERGQEAAHLSFRLLQNESLMHTLTEIEEAIRASWGLDTAEEDDDWTPDNRSRGQCDVTSLVVHDIFGGDILAAEVFRNGERVEAHMWNRLPGGMELDLTRDQFKNGEVIGEPSVRQRPARFDREHPRYHRYQAYLVLARRVRERLSGRRS